MLSFLLSFIFAVLLSSPVYAESAAVSEARRLQDPAVEVVEAAFANTGNPRWQRLAKKLKRAHMKEGMFCKDRIAAMAIPFTNGIGICDGYLSYVYLGDLQGIGTLIHEALHLIGQVNECRADQEVDEVLRDAGLGDYGGAYC